LPYLNKGNLLTYLLITAAITMSVLVLWQLSRRS